MSKRTIWPWLLILLIGITPFVLLLAVGAWWLWKQNLLIDWLGISASCGGIVWIISRQLQQYQQEPMVSSQLKPDTAFSQRDQAAWDAVAEKTEDLKN